MSRLLALVPAAVLVLGPTWKPCINEGRGGSAAEILVLASDAGRTPSDVDNCAQERGPQGSSAEPGAESPRHPAREADPGQSDRRGTRLSGDSAAGFGLPGGDAIYLLKESLRL